ncbi:MAG: acyl-ACP--UDP-N-acetylglucosamine O-acyltransferase [Bauldia sp.]
MGRIHPTAIIDDGARLGADVAIGPYSIVGGAVEIGDGVVLGSHVVVGGRTTVGARTRISSFAAIGGEAQDLSYRAEGSAVSIGPDCLIREYATIHGGTAKGRGTTTVGANCFLMIGAHVAHDCLVGDHVILTNQATLGGHAEIGDYAILGGLAAVQQRTRIGAHAFVGGLTGVTRDVVPFVMVSEHRAQLAGINATGLKRRGFDHQTIQAVRATYNAFFFSTGPRAERIARVAERFGDVPAVRQFIEFLRASGDRPITLPRRRAMDIED